MRLSTVIVSLLFISSLTLILFALSGHAQRTQNVNHIQQPQQGPHPPPQRRRNPIRDRYIQKAGLCPQNYYLNGTRPGFKFFRYHEKLGTCFPIDEKGPCGKNMIFYRVGKTEYGECDCDHKKRCGRPLLYWEGNCYHVNTQGPCQDGQWFIYGLTQKPICQKNLCTSQESESPSNHRARKFWMSINGECMKTRTRGFCPDPDQVMFFREGEAYPQCVYADEAKVCASINQISRPCWSGQKYDLMENCKDKVGLWGSEDDH